MKELTDAIADGKLGARLWLYSNYHCNLTCGYCLTASSPTSSRRLLPAARMIELTREARKLGFTGVGITGGEPFLLADLPETLGQMAELLPVIVLSNGTLFTDRLLARLAPLAQLPVTVQLSLDSADPATNDDKRADGSHADVVAAIEALRGIDIQVRIATTGPPADDAARERLCALHARLGIDDSDHVTRPVVQRGRAADDTGAVEISSDNLPAELTITADGAFWSPFAPTVTGTRLDTDLLICRVTSPLRHAVGHILQLLAGRPPGADAALGIQ